MAAPFLVDQPELFVKLVKYILDLAGATDVGAADQEFAVETAEEFTEVHRLFYCLLK